MVAKAGTKGGRMAAFVLEWAMMQNDLGREDVTVEDYIDWSNVPRRTCYRRAAEYRELFPDVPVNDLASQLAPTLRDRPTRSPAAVPVAL